MKAQRGMNRAAPVLGVLQVFYLFFKLTLHGPPSRLRRLRFRLGGTDPRQVPPAGELACEHGSFLVHGH